MNIDCTVFAQSPKLAPYRERMQTIISQTIDLDPNRINIKATTTERLGVIGAGQGIAAMCVALIRPNQLKTFSRFVQKALPTMGLRIYNTLTRKKETFQPLIPGQVRMYVCGPTVYDLCHIGNARSVVVFDVVARYLRFAGYDVTYVRNLPMWMIKSLTVPICYKPSPEKPWLKNILMSFIRIWMR